MFNILGKLFRNIPQNFIGIFLIYWERLMGMFHEYLTNIYLLGGKKLTFTDNASFRSYISKINNTFVDNTEDHDIVMSMYNLLEYSDNHSIIPGGLLNSSRDEVNDFANENESNALINNNETAASKAFNYKLKLIGSKPGNAS